MDQEHNSQDDTIQDEHLATGQMDIDKVKQQATDYLQGILSRMDFEVSVHCGMEEEDRLLLNIDGSGDLSPLIGEKGATLDAFEYVLGRALSHKYEQRLFFSVDCDGYRERRREALVDMAQRLSEKAKDEGKAVSLNPMSPRDRRIVHMALREESGVFTRSEGEGNDRRILIVPEF